MTAGGKREGAGRKPRKMPRVAITVRLDAQVAKRFRERCKDSGISQSGHVAELLDITKMLEAMFNAQENEGCGWYSDPIWTEQYDKLRNLVGREDAFFHDPFE